MAKQRLLLVDADPGSLKLLGASLRNAGFTVSTATALSEALSLVETVVPDLVIADTKLGEHDGFELVQQLKASPDSASIPFIFLSSDPGVESKITGLELGVDDYLTKPIFLREIIARVRLVLARREREGLEGRSSRTQFSGSLEDMGTVDLVQTIDISRKTGVLELRSGGQRGGIWFREGSIVDAEVGKLRGERAFYRLLLWTEGRFDLHLRAVHREATIRSPAQALLMEGMRRVDEWGRLLEQLPPLDRILDVDDSQLRERLSEIPDEINAVLRAIDGKRSLRGAVDEIAGDDLETLSTIAKLYFEGLVLDTGKRESLRRSSGSFAVPGPLDDESAADASIDPDAVVGVTTQDPRDSLATTPAAAPSSPTDSVSDAHGRDAPARAELGRSSENPPSAGGGTATAQDYAPAASALDRSDTSDGEPTADERASVAGTGELGDDTGLAVTQGKGDEPSDDSGKERRMTRKLGNKRGTRRDSLSQIPPEPTNVIQFPSKGQSGRGVIPAGMKQTLSGLGPEDSGSILPGATDAAAAATAAALMIDPERTSHDEPSQPVAKREGDQTRTSGVLPLSSEAPVVASPVVTVGAPAAAPAASGPSAADARKAEPRTDVEPTSGPSASEPPPAPAPAPTADPLMERPSMATLVVTPALPSVQPASPPAPTPAAKTVGGAAAIAAGVTGEMPAAPSTPPAGAQKPAGAGRDEGKKGKQGKDGKRSGDDWKKSPAEDARAKSSPGRSNPQMDAATDAAARSAPGRSNPRMERVSDPPEANFFTASGEQGQAIVDDFSDLQAERGGPAHPGKWVTLGIVAIAFVALGVFAYWKVMMDPGEASLEGRLDERAALAAATKAVGARERPTPAVTAPAADPPAAPAPAAQSATSEPTEPAATAPTTEPVQTTEPTEPAGTPTEPAAAPAQPAAAPTEPAAPAAAAPTEPAVAATPPATPAAAAATPAAGATAPAATGTYEEALAEGDAAARRGRSRDAVTAYERAITINPAGDAALSALAFIHLNRGRNREAAALAERAVQANQQNAQGWIVLGAARDGLGQRGPAREAYRSCVQHGTGRWVRECRQML